jgi:hypothetical protein
MCFMATASGHFIGAFIGRGRFFYASGGVAQLALCGVFYIPWDIPGCVIFGAAEIPQFLLVLE